MGHDRHLRFTGGVQPAESPAGPRPSDSSARRVRAPGRWKLPLITRAKKARTSRQKPYITGNPGWFRKPRSVIFHSSRPHAPWHRLYLRPEPHGQVSLRPTFPLYAISTGMVLARSRRSASLMTRSLSSRCCSRTSRCLDRPSAPGYLWLLLKPGNRLSCVRK